MKIMRRFLLAILAFLSLSAFDTQKVETPRVDDTRGNIIPHGIDRPIATLLTPKEGKLVVEEGQTIKFSATASGRPIPISSVSYLYSLSNRIELTNTDRITIEKLGSHVTVAIKNAKKSDSGIYEISYTNSDGSSSVIIFVTVIEPTPQP